MLPAIATDPEVVLAELIESVSLSTSVSLLNTFILVVVASSEIVAASGLAIGASLTGVIVTVNVPVVLAMPSVKV